MRSWHRAEASGVVVSEIRVLTPLEFAVDAPWPGTESVVLKHSPIENTVDHIGDCDVLWTQFFTAEMAERATKLRLIQSTGAGIELIDLDAVPPGCDVAVVHEHERPMAEWVIMAMIALNRDTLRADATLRSGSWELGYFRPPTIPELSEQTLGIIGFGHIGQQTARFASALGMKVIAATRTPGRVADPAELGVSRVVGLEEMGTVLAESDFVLLATALTSDTTGLIGAKELALMSPQSSLINVARARVVDEDALFAALRNRDIKSAALDVWWGEPLAPDQKPDPSRHPFSDLDNVLMSPHVSAMTVGTWKRRIQAAADNIDRLVRGEPIQNVIHSG